MRPSRLRSQPIPCHAAVLLVCLAGCADPRLPTGGPADKTPPALESSEPSHETTEFSGDRVRLVFSEYVNEASAQRAFSITPELQGRIRFRWRKRRVDVIFPEPLMENTTYVVTMGNDLRDSRGVALRSPITLAFATGPVIDRGRLGGRLVEPLKGKPAAGFDVLAWSLPDSTAPDSLPSWPDYRTQTDEEGRFVLQNVREEAYFVLALNDRNRNRHPDANERFAVPPQPVLQATQNAEDAARPWIVTHSDTTRPAVERVRAWSSTRLQVRFSESIVVTGRDPTAWSLEDSTTGRAAQILSIYRPYGNARDIFLRTESLGPGVWTLRPDAALADSSGNRVLRRQIRFTSSLSTDTTALRFLRFLPRQGTEAIPLAPSAHAAVVFNQPLQDSLKHRLIVASDTSGQPFDMTIATIDGTTYTVDLENESSSLFDVIVHAPDSARTQRYRILEDRDLGSLSGIAHSADSTMTVMVELYGTGLLAALPADSTGAFMFTGIPEAPFSFRAVGDLNGNGRWDGGKIFPYEAAEPLAWSSDPLTARPRWDTALADTLYIFMR